MIYVVCVVYMQFVLTFLVDQKHYIASACTIHLLSLVLFFWLCIFLYNVSYLTLLGHLAGM